MSKLCVEGSGFTTAVRCGRPGAIPEGVGDPLEGAKGLRLDHKIGTLTPGKEADIILLDAEAIHVAPLNVVPGTVQASRDYLFGAAGIQGDLFRPNRCRRPPIVSGSGIESRGCVIRSTSGRLALPLFTSAFARVAAQT